MFKKFTHTAITVILLAAGNAQAAVLEFGALLSGAQEVPANASTATGSAFVLFNDASKEFTWNLSFNGLSSAIGGDGSPTAHVHKAPAGAEGPVEFAIDGSNPGTVVDGTGMTSGIFTGVRILTLAQESALFAGDLYFNLHTELFPGGEIRGQILPGGVTVVPLPGALVLLGSAFGGLLAMRRRSAR
ncbi:MAG: CHRD domain-containing protein [Gammaproteobacteria bacterium]